MAKKSYYPMFYCKSLCKGLYSKGQLTALCFRLCNYISVMIYMVHSTFLFMLFCFSSDLYGKDQLSHLCFCICDYISTKVYAIGKYE